MNRGGKLAPEVNRALFVKNLRCVDWCRRARYDGYRDLDSDELLRTRVYNVTPEELFDLFGKFGAIRQIRQGIAANTKGTAFVVYEDVTDSKAACDKLNGFNFQNRYLVVVLMGRTVLYHQPEKMRQASNTSESIAARKESLEQLKAAHASMGPSSRVGNHSPEDVRNKRMKGTRRTHSAPIATTKSPTITKTTMHGKEGKYQHVEVRGESGEERRNTSFLAIVRGLISRR
ncbi:pre-mRNA branch site p14 protein [Rutstroemia sp. NJR-2017a BVV2]|nr:pre-mRNA branch site p14 protein [Rutstroemia sp. NJR-2017a BVV2]